MIKALIAAGTALLLAGCGSSSSADPSVPSGETAASTITPTTEPDPSSPGEENEQLQAPAMPEENREKATKQTLLQTSNLAEISRAILESGKGDYTIKVLTSGTEQPVTALTVTKTQNYTSATLNDGTITTVTVSDGNLTCQVEIPQGAPVEGGEWACAKTGSDAATGALQTFQGTDPALLADENSPYPKFEVATKDGKTWIAPFDKDGTPAGEFSYALQGNSIAFTDTLEGAATIVAYQEGFTGEKLNLEEIAKTARIVNPQPGDAPASS